MAILQKQVPIAAAQRERQLYSLCLTPEALQKGLHTSLSL